MELQDQVEFYNNYWGKLSKFGSYKIKRISVILSLLDDTRKFKKNPKILDLGCGDGRACAIWNEIGPTTGFDLSVSAMEIARQRYPFIEFHSGNAVATDFEDDTFDVIISQEVLEHIEVQEDYINECYRLLKPGGFMILTTPNKYYFDRRNGGNYSNQPIENILLPKTLKAMLSKQFKIVKFFSMIHPRGDKGIYKFFGFRPINLFIAGFKLMALRNYFFSKYNLGLHLVTLVQKTK